MKMHLVQIPVEVLRCLQEMESDLNKTVFSVRACLRNGEELVLIFKLCRDKVVEPCHEAM